MTKSNLKALEERIKVLEEQMVERRAFNRLSLRIFDLQKAVAVAQSAEREVITEYEDALRESLK